MGLPGDIGSCHARRGAPERRDAYTAEETSAIDSKAIEILGPPLDLMLNDAATWRMPVNVCEFRIGGYQGGRFTTSA
jgi:hypothetical protein